MNDTVYRNASISEENLFPDRHPAGNKFDEWSDAMEERRRLKSVQKKGAKSVFPNGKKSSKKILKTLRIKSYKGYVVCDFYLHRNCIYSTLVRSVFHTSVEWTGVKCGARASQVWKKRHTSVSSKPAQNTFWGHYKSPLYHLNMVKVGILLFYFSLQSAFCNTTETYGDYPL